MKHKKSSQKLLKKIKSWIKSVFCCIVVFQNITCITAVKPEFDFLDDLVLVDAIVSTIPGASYVNLSTSKNLNTPIEDATVWFINTDTDEVVNLDGASGVYLPPVDFVANEGESWKMGFTLPNGKRYESLSETILRSLPINNPKITYSRELFYSNTDEMFVPGHAIIVDVVDSVDEENYYYWDFRSFEKLRICHECSGGFIFRNGECVDNPQSNTSVNFSYACDTDCWTIRYNNRIKIFSDEFSNGIITKSLLIADVPLYTKEDIVVELQQFSLSSSAYEYYKILKDLLENNSSLNAPPPSALIGNMFNLDDADEYVLGRFTATSASKVSLFIDRTNIVEDPIEKRNAIQFETSNLVCPGQNTDCTVLFANCEESRFRTGIKPEGWIE